jgi:ATP-dependent DNA helicase DinG
VSIPAPAVSPTFERLVTGLGLARRERQDAAVSIVADAIAQQRVAIVQAPTGIGKSFVALSAAGDVGRPGSPGVIATVSNLLSDQYVRDARRFADVTGRTFARLLGGSHYLCADAVDSDAPPYDDSTEESAAQSAAERYAWLADKLQPGVDEAQRFELRANGYRTGFGVPKLGCPGFPVCAGRAGGGCGSKLAREFAYTVDVVVTNFHMLTLAQRVPADVYFLPPARAVIVDETHRLPEVLADIDGRQLTEGAGQNTFLGDECADLREATKAWIRATLDSARWSGSKQWDTEGVVRSDEQAYAVWLAAWNALPEGTRAGLIAPTVDPDATFDPGTLTQTLAILAHVGHPAGYTPTWRAWTTRKPLEFDRGAVTRWEESRTIELRRVDAAEKMTPALVRCGALLSGTIGLSFPARVGMPQHPVIDLGQQFDWSTVAGRISPLSGVKSSLSRDALRESIVTRAHQLAAHARPHLGSLVLCNSHADVREVARQLTGLLPRHVIHAQPATGGSLAANVTREQFVNTVRRGQPSVLIGTESYATGVDLPGALCTLVAWWTCHRGGSGYFDDEVHRHYAWAGDYAGERFRTRFAQGIGRLLRTPTDTGELVICDSRMWSHLQGATGPIDRHLTLVPWAQLSTNGVTR